MNSIKSSYYSIWISISIYTVYSFRLVCECTSLLNVIYFRVLQAVWKIELSETALIVSIHLITMNNRIWILDYLFTSDSIIMDHPFDSLNSFNSYSRLILLFLLSYHIFNPQLKSFFFFLLVYYLRFITILIKKTLFQDYLEDFLLYLSWKWTIFYTWLAQGPDLFRAGPLSEVI